MPQNFLNLNQDHKETLSDRLLKASANATSALLTITSLDDAVNTALKIIGEALDTDRVTVIEHFNCPEQSLPCWKMLYEWDSLDTISQISHPEVSQGTYEGIESWYESINQGQNITYLTKDMSEPFRSGQEKLGVKALHVVPIFVENKCWGVVGFDDCRGVKHRGQSELSMLRIAANSIGSAIQRDRTQQALLRSQQERATELEKANKALRNAIAGMARLDNLEHFLAEMLKASIEISGAHSGAVALIEGEFIRHAVLFDRDGWIDPQIQMSRGLTIAPFTPELKYLAAQLVKSPFEWGIPPDDPRIMPEYREFHREHNNKAIRLVPMQISDRLIGWLGLGFAEENPPIGKSFGLLKVLAEQMTMAVEMLRLSNEAQQTAIAREREQSLLVNEKQRTAELEKANEALSRSLSWLAREENLNNFLEQILLEISATVKADIAHLFILHQPERMLEIVARVVDGKLIQSPAPSEPAIFSAPFPADITPIFAMMEEQDLLLTLDMLNIQPEVREITWPDNYEWHINLGRKAIGALVLKAGDRTVGFLGFGFNEKQELVGERRELVIALANQAALAILLMQLAEQSKQSAIAHEQEQAAAARVVQLVKANAVLKQTLDVLATEPEIESSLGHVLKVSSEQLDSPSSALWLYNSFTEKFYLHLVYMDNQIIPVTDENIDILSGKWLRGRNMDKDLFLKKHIRERSPVIYQVDDASVVPPPLRKSLGNMGVKTLLGIPLLLGAEIIGSFTLRFAEKRQFQAEELELTQALANQATLAIQLLRMAEESKQAAIYAERNRLAGEIHDTLAQAFTGISLQLGVVKWLIQEGSLAIEPILDRINDIAQTGLAEARRSVWEIYPTAQEYSNLAEKISQSVEKLTSDCPIQVDLQILGSEYQVSAMIGYNLLKLAQEAITNALKHAKATKLSIILTYKDALVSLSITDNGCGFQPNLDNGGFGLLSISERCDRIGGQLLINSILGKGTEILVEIPLEEQKS